MPKILDDERVSSPEFPDDQGSQETSPINRQVSVEDGEDRLAINLIDIDRLQPVIRQMMLADKVDTSGVINGDPSKFDEMGIVFTSDLLTAAAVCDVIRSEDRRMSQYPTRIYLFRKTSWSKIPGSAVLTEVVEGEVRLRRDLFKVEIQATEEVPLQTEAMEI